MIQCNVRDCEAEAPYSGVFSPRELYFCAKHWDKIWEGIEKVIQDVVDEIEEEDEEIFEVVDVRILPQRGNQ